MLHRSPLSFNQVRQQHLGEPERVRLFYDRAKRVIGIQASRKDDPGALRIWSYRGLKRSYHVSAKGFYAYFGLRPDTTRWYGGTMRAGILTCPLETEDRIGHRAVPVCIAADSGVDQDIGKQSRRRTAP